MALTHKLRKPVASGEALRSRHKVLVAGVFLALGLAGVLGFLRWACGAGTSDTQGEKDARYEHFVSRAKRLARCHRLAQFVSECHRRIPFVGSTVVRRRSTDLPDL